MSALPQRLVGCSTKSFLTLPAAAAWVAGLEEHLADRALPGSHLYACLPGPLIGLFGQRLAGLGVILGAQDVSRNGPGPYTGEVSAELLAGLGVRVVAVGHPERRALGDTPGVVAAKAGRVIDAGMAPVVIVGEDAASDDVSTYLAAQLHAVLAGRVPRAGLVVAYEPTWAIGAPRPAPPRYVARACAALRRVMDDVCDEGRLVYGGSAGPGVFTAIERAAAAGSGGAPDGVFLGRACLDPAGVADALAEVLAADVVADGQHRLV